MPHGLNFPQFEFKTRMESGKLQIFDPVRKKYVNLNPEEIVRQHVISYLTDNLQVPMGMISVEKKIIVNGLTRRPDLVVYNPSGRPMLIVECKAPDIALNESVVFQVAQYHRELNAAFIFLTNGIRHFFFRHRNQTKSLELLEAIPNYSEMCVDAQG